MFNLTINNIKLQNLLERKRDYIGCNIEGPVEILISAVGNFYAISMNGGLNSAINIGFFVICSIVFLRGVIMTGKAVVNNYNHNKLYNDIKNLDEKPHAFSLAVIRDTFKTYPNKYLLKFDQRWNCYLLPYYKTSEGNKVMLQGLSGDLQIAENLISVQLKCQKIYEKYSESDKYIKVYDHKFFEVVIENMPSFMQQDEFEIENIKYKWFSLDEMKADSDILDKNTDVIDILSEIVY